MGTPVKSICYIQFWTIKWLGVQYVSNKPCAIGAQIGTRIFRMLIARACARYGVYSGERRRPVSTVLPKQIQLADDSIRVTRPPAAEAFLS